MGCFLFVVGAASFWTAADDNTLPAVRWAALGLLVVVLVLGTVLELRRGTR